MCGRRRARRLGMRRRASAGVRIREDVTHGPRRPASRRSTHRSCTSRRRARRLHVASVTIFDGPAPSWDELRAHVEARLHLVPRFRQRLAEVPLDQGRPVWVDDPHFNLRYHLRHAGLPAPGSEEQLKNLAGRLFAQPLDRTKPLWELSLVDGLVGRGRFALDRQEPPRARRRRARAWTSRGCCSTPSPTPRRPPRAGEPVGRARPSPPPRSCSPTRCSSARPSRSELARSAARRRARPAAGCCAARATALQAAGALTFAGLEPAPPTPLNVKVGPHRRYTWVDAELAELRAIKDSLGGTVNDAVLAVVAGALGPLPAPPRRRHARPRAQGDRARSPCAPRTPRHGNVVAPLAAPLPVGIEDPVEQYRAIRDAASVARRHARGGRRAHADRARRLRVADDHEPGRAPAAEPALLQPRRDERARPAVPALPARAPAARAVPGRPDHRPPGARRSRS